MKRVLTLATAGVFSLGLVLLPLAANAAEPAAASAKDGKPVAAATATGTATGTTTATTAAPVKNDDKVTTGATMAPGGGTTAGTTAPKPPVKSGS